jgi:hypothetical protein
LHGVHIKTVDLNPANPLRGNASMHCFTDNFTCPEDSQLAKLAQQYGHAMQTLNHYSFL